MTVIAQRIESAISQLSLEEMLQLHQKLLASISEMENAQALDPAYATEIRKRIDEIDSEQITGIDAFQALKVM